MARPKRKKLKFDEESLNGLLQEIYNDSHNIRAQIITLFNKWEKYAEDGGSVAALGKDIINLIRAQAKNQDQKIMLLKYLKDVVHGDSDSKKSDESESSKMTPKRRNELLRMVENDLKSRD
ncbi:MAG: hypothetical protein ACOCVF_01785 [bacterium]